MSHHVLVTAALQTCVPRMDRFHKKSRSDLSALSNINFSNRFFSLFDECMQKSLESQPGIIATARGLCYGMAAAFHDVAETCLPKVELKAGRPWIRITTETLSLISRRDEARQHWNFALEQQLSVLIKRRVRIDRTDWLEALLSSGD